MLSFLRQTLAATALVSLAFGCSSSETSSSAPAPTGECTAAATRCAALQVETCDAATLKWSAAADCTDGLICRDGSGCTALTADEEQRVAALSALLAESRTNAARPIAVDYPAIEATLRTELLTGDGSPKAYVQTMWNALMALPQGHQLLGPAKLDTQAEVDSAMSLGFVVGALTVYGTCMSPYLDHAVVTIASKSSVLHVGDEVVAIDGKRGAELQALVIRQPDGVDLIPPTTTGRFAFGVRAFLGRDRKGTVVTVKRAGVESDVTLPVGGSFASAVSCADPFGRDSTAPALGSLLADGTGVLYLPAFQYKNVAAFEIAVGPEFDKVKAAPRLVVDLRGNSGGSLNSALDFVAQLPNAKQAEYCEFFDRTPGTEPPAYTSAGRRAVAPGAVPPAKRFAYGGRVALLVDGATFSAAEHFVLAARTAASVLVIGTKTAGSYGNTSNDVPKALPGDPALQVVVNRSQVRGLDGKPLDGVSQEPDILVEYEPSAIADGKDPMMLRAVTELSK